MFKQGEPRSCLVNIFSVNCEVNQSDLKISNQMENIVLQSLMFDYEAVNNNGSTRPDSGLQRSNITDSLSLVFSLGVSVSWSAPPPCSRTYRAAEEVRATNGKPSQDWSQVGTDPRISVC